MGFKKVIYMDNSFLKVSKIINRAVNEINNITILLKIPTGLSFCSLFCILCFLFPLNILGFLISFLGFFFLIVWKTWDGLMLISSLLFWEISFVNWNFSFGACLFT